MDDLYLEKKILPSSHALAPEVQDQLLQLTKWFEDVIPSGRKLLASIPTDSFKETRYIKVNILERHINRIEVISSLFEQWKNSRGVEDSIGLIIRACLSDILSQFYIEDLHSKVKKTPSQEEDEYLKATSSLLADHIRAGLIYNKAQTNAGVITREQSREAIDKWKSLYPPYFNEEPLNYDKPIKNVLPERFPSASEIIKLIRNSNLLKKFNLDNLYINYFFYSKYEHFGVTTNHIQYSDINMTFDNMMSSLSYILLSCQILSVHLEIDNDKFYSQFDSEYKADSEASEKFFSIREELVRILNEDRSEES